MQEKGGTMLNLRILVISLFISGLAAADVLQIEPGSQRINGVSVGGKALVQSDNGTPVTLYPVGSALTSKTIVGFPVPVYVGEFFVSDVNQWKKPVQNPLD